MNKSNSGSHIDGSNGIFSSIRTQHSNSGEQSSKLMTLFVNELQEIYWSEHALTNAIPTMIKNATSEDLIEALTIHLSETEMQIIRLKQVFEILGKEATKKKCAVIEVLLTEAILKMEVCEAGAMRDAGIISVAHKVEHYEIAAYGTLRQLANALDLDDAVELLRLILDSEMEADEILSEVSISAINVLKSEKSNANCSYRFEGKRAGIQKKIITHELKMGL